MNFQSTPIPEPIRVLVVNPLVPASQLFIVKMLSGSVFGCHQKIDLILLVYFNERETAGFFKTELELCALSCTKSITVSSDLPNVTDADVFCFITNFINPNCIDFEKLENDEQFDTLYLIIKIANNFEWSTEEKPIEDDFMKSRKYRKPEKKVRKPVFLADGLVAIDILKSLSRNMPSDIFFCPTPLPAVAKSVLGDYLKVQCDAINDVYVWAGNDGMLHVEIEKPIIIHDKVTTDSHCDWDMAGKDLLESLNLDHTQFNASWLKKEFIEKIESTALRNPYGCIYKASEIAKTLRGIWMARSNNDGMKSCINLGVISDGSLCTLKGYPYVLPLVLCGESWSVNKCFEEDIHLKLEIKRINKAVKEHHHKLIPYCKNFLEVNVIKQAFIPDDDQSGSLYSYMDSTDTSKPSATGPVE